MLKMLIWHLLHIFATYVVERWFSTHCMNFPAAVVPTLKWIKGKVPQRWTKEYRFFYHTWKTIYSTYFIKLSWKPRLCWIITSGCSSPWESLGSFEVHGSMFRSDRELWGFLTERKYLHSYSSAGIVCSTDGEGNSCWTCLIIFIPLNL